MLTHTGEKRHQCQTCGKRFTKSHHLKSHLNTHLKALNKQTSMGQSGAAAQRQDQTKNEPQRIHEIIKHEPQMQVQTEELLHVVQFNQFQVIN